MQVVPPRRHRLVIDPQNGPPASFEFYGHRPCMSTAQRLRAAMDIAAAKLVDEIASGKRQSFRPCDFSHAVLGALGGSGAGVGRGGSIRFGGGSINTYPKCIFMYFRCIRVYFIGYARRRSGYISRKTYRVLEMSTLYFDVVHVRGVPVCADRRQRASKTSPRAPYGHSRPRRSQPSPRRLLGTRGGTVSISSVSETLCTTLGKLLCTPPTISTGAPCAVGCARGR